ncbi:tyrosine-type recombinase/integrase [Moorellaceae bacterium AZ2]
MDHQKNCSHNVLAPFLDFLSTQHLSENTVRSYQFDLEDFAGWYLETTGEHVRPNLVTELDLAEYRQHLMRCKKPNTVNRRLAAIKKWLSWAQDTGQIGRLPRLPKRVRQEKLAPRALSRKEQNALLRAVERAGNPRDKALVYVLLFCGLRVGELVTLRVEDLEIKERSGKLIVRGKGDKYREIPVPSNVRNVLRKYLGERKSGPLFLGQRGPLTVRGVQQLLKKYAYLAKLENLSPHVLRHTCATNLLNKGVDLVKVAAILGHENLNTTAVYTRPTFQDLMAAVEEDDDG